MVIAHHVNIKAVRYLWLNSNLNSNLVTIWGGVRKYIKIYDLFCILQW